MRVLAFGTFDGLHPGHIFYLKEAKKLGDELWVIVGRDATVKKVKNEKPLSSENERLSSLIKSGYVDHALLGDNKDPYKLVSKIKPDIIALGYDQVAFTEKLDTILKKNGLKHTEIVRLPSHHPKKYKSSLIKQSEKPI